jgi:hypothetical protein
MMEKPVSFGQPRSPWDKFDAALMVVSIVAVGSGFLFLQRINGSREEVRSVLKEEQLPANNAPANIAATNSTD